MLLLGTYSFKWAFIPFLYKRKSSPWSYLTVWECELVLKGSHFVVTEFLTIISLMFKHQLLNTTPTHTIIIKRKSYFIIFKTKLLEGLALTCDIPSAFQSWFSLRTWDQKQAVAQQKCQWVGQMWHGIHLLNKEKWLLFETIQLSDKFWSHSRVSPPQCWASETQMRNSLC